MQSCQSFYAICNRISLRRRGATLAFPPTPSTTGSADRFDVASIKDLSSPLRTSSSFFSIDSRTFRSLSSVGKKSVPRFFSSPLSFLPLTGHPRYRAVSRESVFTGHDRVLVFSVIKPVVYGQNSFPWDSRAAEFRPARTRRCTY